MNPFLAFLFYIFIYLFIILYLYICSQLYSVLEKVYKLLSIPNFFPSRSQFICSHCVSDEETP